MEVITMRFVIAIAIAILGTIHGLVSVCNAINTGTTFWYVSFLTSVFVVICASGYVETQAKP
jgi:hypothetical protein